MFYSLVRPCHSSLRAAAWSSNSLPNCLLLHRSGQNETRKFADFFDFLAGAIFCVGDRECERISYSILLLVKILVQPRGGRLSPLLIAPAPSQASHAQCATRRAVALGNSHWQTAETATSQRALGFKHASDAELAQDQVGSVGQVVSSDRTCGRGGGCDAVE